MPNLLPRLMALAALCLAVASTSAADVAGGHAPRRPNVLFIAIDDLRPQLACYGQLQMHTPHIDRLADRGVMFDRAYCMVPVCGASRASLMTGLRPTRDRFLNAATWAERDAPDVTPLNAWFKEHGYVAINNGKVFHNQEDCQDGWSEPPWRPDHSAPYLLPGNRQTHRDRMKQKRVTHRNGPAWEAADVPDDAYGDGQTLEKSLIDLRRLTDSEEPFFLAVGFYKPHLPFVAPQKYWDLYDPRALSLPTTYSTPQDVPRQALNNWAELRGYAGMPAKGPVSVEDAIRLIHGYNACVSYVDALVGRLLDELDRCGAAQNTIVILWGDHGWNLGDHSLWCKHSCYESAMRAPLIVAAPGVSGGHRSEALVEFIDVYPTLCDLAGLPAPTTLAGDSFRPLLSSKKLWKDAAYGRFRDGETVRTATHRYTEYSTPQGDHLGSTLFDFLDDPQERVNVASLQENVETLEELKGLLRKKTKRTDWQEVRMAATSFDSPVRGALLFATLADAFQFGLVLRRVEVWVGDGDHGVGVLKVPLDQPIQFRH